MQHEKRLVFAGFDRWCWEEKGWTANTATLYRREAVRAEKWLEANRRRSLFSANLNDLKAFRSEVVAPSAIRWNQVMYALRAFLDYLVDQGYRTTNPAREIPTLPEHKNDREGLPEDIIEVLWSEAKACGPRMGALFGLMWWMGLRREETRTLEWGMIDGDVIHVNGKGEGERKAPARSGPCRFIRSSERLWRTGGPNVPRRAGSSPLRGIPSDLSA